MKRMKWVIPVTMGVGLMWASSVRAGDLTPPGAPAATMYTLEEIYQQLLVTQQQAEHLKARMHANGIVVSSGDMVLIPAGSFEMGDAFAEGYAHELPVHEVTVSAFYMGKTEVTMGQWDEVYQWATNNGYGFTNQGAGKGANHPVHTVNWYDSIAWCNARSQWAGFTPCYTNASGTLYTNSLTALPIGCIWSANGYRLPTEAEWEKAARGNVGERRFPWEDANTIQHVRANYYADTSTYAYDTSAQDLFHPDYEVFAMPYTSPGSDFAANGYGLYDMAGNVSEWCWDWFDPAYYASSPTTDPRGPGSSLYRVQRGGSWYDAPDSSRVAHRGSNFAHDQNNTTGFRVVRAAP